MDCIDTDQAYDFSCSIRNCMHAILKPQKIKKINIANVLWINWYKYLDKYLDHIKYFMESIANEPHHEKT